MLTVLLLVVRFIWKLLNTEPKALETHKPWEISVAHFLQHVFYILIALIGVAGYLVSTSKGKGIDFFNGFEVPAVLGEMEESTADLFASAHEILAYVLAALVILHAAAAVKHHFIDKDNTLKRMLGR
jgi:cytochrome b561